MSCCCAPESANPAGLGQNGYLQDERFLSFLRYLEYWRRPEYSRALRYPHCLFFLSLLQSDRCRHLLARKDVADWLAFSQFHCWQFHRSNQLERCYSSGDSNGQPPYTVPLDDVLADDFKKQQTGSEMVTMER